MSKVQYSEIEGNSTGYYGLLGILAALIAAGLANHMTTGELCRIFMGQKHASLKFEPSDFLRPAYKEFPSPNRTVGPVARAIPGYSQHARREGRSFYANLERSSIGFAGQGWRPQRRRRQRGRTSRQSRWS